MPGPTLTAALAALDAAEPVDVLDIPLGVNLVAVAAGAMVGTLRAGEEERVDIVGMFMLALSLGLGGGLIRDVLLGNLPPAAFRTPAYIATVLVATVVGSVFLAYLDHLERSLWVLDSLSIGLFASVGVNAALLAGLTFLPAVLIGTVASVGGLVLADALQGRPSALIFRGPPIMLAGLAGAVTYALVYEVVPEIVVTLLAVGAAFLVRISGPVWNVQSPVPLRRPIGLRTRLRLMWARLGARPRRRPGSGPTAAPMPSPR